MADEPLIPKHGGYRNLKTFQLAELIFDVTVRFCDRYIDKRSRTHDQMVQAARSGVQNIVEGSKLSGTSKKMELKLTNVARASLEELQRDYRDFLRQRGLTLWDDDDPRRKALVARRCRTVDDVSAWIREIYQAPQATSGPDGPQAPEEKKSASTSISSIPSIPGDRSTTSRSWTSRRCSTIRTSSRPTSTGKAEQVTHRPSPHSSIQSIPSISSTTPLVESTTPPRSTPIAKTSTTAETHSQLASFIWSICNLLRGPSHGAGRRMSRTQAKSKYTWRAVQKDLEQKGVRVLSAGADEVPYVYKNIEDVMREQSDLVDIVARFDPKMCDDGRSGGFSRRIRSLVHLKQLSGGTSWQLSAGGHGS